MKPAYELHPYRGMRHVLALLLTISILTACAQAPQTVQAVSTQSVAIQCSNYVACNNDCKATFYQCEHDLNPQSECNSILSTCQARNIVPTGNGYVLQ